MLPDTRNGSARFFTPGMPTAPQLCAAVLLFILVASIPAKWATSHIAGLMFVLSLFLARGPDWRSSSFKAFLLLSSLWLAPIALSTLIQHLVSLKTATPPLELVKLILRTAGVGLGIIFLLERRWLTLKQLTLIVLAALAVHAVAGLVDWLQRPTALQLNWRRIRLEGLTGNPNPFGTFMALNLILCTGLLRFRPRNVALYALLAISAVCVFASGSRGAILVSSVGVLIVFLPLDRRTLLILAAGLLAAGIAYIAADLSLSFSQSDQSRLAALRFAADAIEQRLLTGWGVGSFALIPGHKGVKLPHNMLADLAISSGLIALLGWAVSTAWLAKRLVEHDTENARIALALLIATILAGTLEYSLTTSAHFRGIWVLITTAACYVISQPKPRTP